MSVSTMFFFFMKGLEIELTKLILLVLVSPCH